MANAAVIGGGYVGLVTSAGLVALGHSVTCVEANGEKLERLQRGSLPIYEPGLDDLFREGLDSGRLRFVSDCAEAVPAAEFVFIAVHTPARPAGDANTDYVFAAVAQCLELLSPDAVLVVKSTVPVGTGDEIARLVAAAGRENSVVANPEFLCQGSAIKTFLQPARIVIGASDELAAGRTAALFRTIDAPRVITTRRSAELGKYAANAVLAARISLMNEIAAIADAEHADILEVERIVGSDPRIGPDYLRAGLGWGGSCFPKDTLALAATAMSHELEPRILRAVHATNQGQRRSLADLIRVHVSRIEKPVVAMLGLAFKPGTDDLRESPALEIARALAEDGIALRLHDPVAARGAALALPEATIVPEAADIARGADFLVIATAWPEYLELDWAGVGASMRTPVLFDGRNVMDPEMIEAAGMTYLSFGRSARLARVA